jgi:hypothetical protein
MRARSTRALVGVMLLTAGAWWGGGLAVGRAGDAPPASATPPAASRDDDTRPRQQHYVFAHRLLRDLFLRDPAGFLGELNQDGDEFLQAAWMFVGIKLTGEPDTASAQEVKHEARKLDDGSLVVLITMPRATRMPEAIFVAAVYRPASEGREEVARFVTLEFSRPPGTEVPITVLAEWQGERHLNFGRGPAPTLNEFFASVVALLAAPPS